MVAIRKITFVLDLRAKDLPLFSWDTIVTGYDEYPETEKLSSQTRAFFRHCDEKEMRGAHHLYNKSHAV